MSEIQFKSIGETLNERISELQACLGVENPWNQTTCGMVRGVYFALQPHVVVLNYNDPAAARKCLATWNQFLKTFEFGMNHRPQNRNSINVLSSSLESIKAVKEDPDSSWERIEMISSRDEENSVVEIGAEENLSVREGQERYQPIAHRVNAFVPFYEVGIG